MIAKAPDRVDQLQGVLLGAAVGDSLGLPREGLSPQRAARMYGSRPLEHRFLLGRGMASDDTEHACLTAQALLAAPGEEDRFARALAWRLRGWLAAMPAAVGWATLRSIVKLWLGFSPHASGVFSAGNGPAMRAPVIGACLADDHERIERMIRASTRMTHTDPRAEEGALAIALAAAHGVRGGPLGVSPGALLDEIGQRTRGEELRRALDQVGEHLARGTTAAEFARALGFTRGVSGYMLHTVPAALFCWLSSPGDVERSVEEVILLGGDADSTGAIVGALSGATAGASAIPIAWLEGLTDFPRSTAWMMQLGARLAESFGATRTEGAGPGPLPLFWPAIPIRNMLFLAVALAHGFRRMLPPY
ncbi:ADP-ribosylglycohydrolase family protein [Polyangium sp. 15x6]|uniref:ADP-ribosylglycohydrolase family protein n=1 Tax=Polyangium sp. 15x6 TaxID=3042687 RepID=UPI00249B81E4|nr:ADP-ribosylglycohydrolase family protein [Polyangium sp. 15x6]MDI3282136.1 ADP-ribosylglycohydrolase family protein [Polyangium sp. 15x6]